MDDGIRKSRKGIYHLSLAYGFSQSQHSILMKQMKEHLDHYMQYDQRKQLKNEKAVNILNDWYICLYSCDYRMRSVEEMYQMNVDNYTTSCFSNGIASCQQKHSKQSLNYRTGDLVGLTTTALALTTGQLNTNCSSGLASGINLNTGLNGHFNPEFGVRRPQYDAWILHVHMQLVPNSYFCNTDLQDICGGNTKETVTIKKSLSDNSVSLLHGKRKGNEKFLRRFLVMRHGERMDFCFRNWLGSCFDESGIYRRFNLNMPDTILPRNPQEYFYDPPLTVLGLRVSLETGIALRRAGFRLTYCYSSPALRCIQTASECLKGLDQENVKIRIEPLLFEWMGWYKSHYPEFLSPEVLYQFGYPVDRTYAPLSKESELTNTESPAHYYERKGRLVKNILDHNRRKGTNILFVGHAGSLDVCTRPFLNQYKGHWPSNISNSEFHNKSASIPFCGLILAEERQVTGGPIPLTRWVLAPPPTPPFSHTKNSEFNWKKIFTS